ncbi:MAG: ATP synthase F0 subunit B [Deltaproteobacteria bacterium]|nr:ATP synthase F0 subunit B [Deltaproteobacteria bacterium]
MVKSLKPFLMTLLFSLLLAVSGNGYAEDAQSTREATAAGSHESSGDEAGAHEGHDAHALNWIDLSNEETPPLVPMFFNFIIVAFAVYFLLRKGLGAKIRNRRKDLEEALAEANALKKEAEAAMAQARERSERLDDEMARIRAEILEAAKAQAARIESEAAARAERMQGESAALIAQEVAMMAAAIRREAVNEIIAIAEKRIAEKLNSTDHEKLAKEYVNSVMSAVQTGK